MPGGFERLAFDREFLHLAAPDFLVLASPVGDIVAPRLYDGVRAERIAGAPGVQRIFDPLRAAAGEHLVIGEDLIAGGVWRVPPGASQPGSLSPFTEGVLALSVGGTGAGDPIVGTFSGVFNDAMARQP